MAKLTEKQAKFIKYLKANPEASNREAYLMCYDVKTTNLNTIDSSVSKLINTPSVTQALKEIERKVTDEIAYTALDSFKKLTELQEIALGHRCDPEKNLKDAIKCEELKGKLRQFYVDKKEISGTGGGAITIVVNSNIKEED